MRGLVIFLFVGVFYSYVVGSDDIESREVKTRQGLVKGYKDPESGVFMFHSIPYATAPTGSQRYKAPLPAPAWISTFEAIDKEIVCQQVHNPFLGTLKNVSIQEDCLVASVYVPDTEDKNLPVVVYVHGGAYQIGFGNMVSPVPFIKNRNIIAVTFNYRLGVSGFLCLGTEGAPGNAGLKDQLAALRWVKDNIAAFGGNPNEVTISGGSAGSVSADILMLSKATKGLFNKVILESGSSVGVIAVQIDPTEYARNYARRFGFEDEDDIYALEDFYTTTPFETFYQAMDFDNKNSTFGFTPCVERNTGAEVILHDAPINIIIGGDYRRLPTLIGFTSMEGLFRLNRFDEWKAPMTEQFQDFLPADLQFEIEDIREEVADQVKEFYFEEDVVSKKNILSFIEYFTDILFGYPTLRAVKAHVEAGHDQMYLYEYWYADENTTPVPHTNFRGADHCAQTMAVLDARIYMFDQETNVTEKFEEFQAVIQEMWSNFIVTGNPVPESSSLPKWSPVGYNRSPHMSLGNNVSLQGPFLEQRARFWDSIYAKFYRTPVPPVEPPPRHTEL